MNLDDDIVRLILQEQQLVFSNFDLETAWRLGSSLRHTAHDHRASVAIEVSLRDQPVFYSAMPGTTVDNADWIRRKRNTVLHFSRSSYRVGCELAQKGETLSQSIGLPLRDYSTHGGGFPILLAGVGCIGAVVVSGLPQREDHHLVVQALADVLGKNYSSIALD